MNYKVIKGPLPFAAADPLVLLWASPWPKTHKPSLMVREGGTRRVTDELIYFLHQRCFLIGIKNRLDKQLTHHCRQRHGNGPPSLTQGVLLVPFFFFLSEGCFFRTSVLLFANLFGLCYHKYICPFLESNHFTLYKGDLYAENVISSAPVCG